MARMPSVTRASWLGAALLLTACGGGGATPAAPPTVGSQEPPAPAPVPAPFAIPRAVFAAEATSPHADDLVPCLVDPGVDGVAPSCDTVRLPLIGQETDAPTVPDVMARVLVEEPWMAERFRTVVEGLPPGALRMFRSVTGVLVGTVRPSFYTPVTGAIYLDALYLAADGVQLGDVDTDTPDFRAGFGDALSFELAARYGELPRTLGDGRYALGTFGGSQVISSLVLLHELTHAADFFPPERIAAVDPGRPIDEVSFAGERISDALQVNLPLRSTLLRELAAVRFLGETATAEQRAVTPEEVAGAFETDGAAHFYSYATPFEDLAMLLEVFWATYGFGFPQEIFVLPRVENAQRCEDIPVVWGRRGRIHEPMLADRLRYVLPQVIPGEADRLLEWFDQVGGTVSFPPGTTLCDLQNNYDQTAAAPPPPVLPGTVVDAGAPGVLRDRQGRIRAIH